jgi:hypothetical protein
MVQDFPMIAAGGDRNGFRGSPEGSAGQLDNNRCSIKNHVANINTDK